MASIFGADIPDINFGIIGDLPQTYAQGQARAREEALRSALAGGLPRGPGGEIDYNALTTLAAQHGLPIEPYARLGLSAASQKHSQAALAEATRHHKAVEAQGLRPVVREVTNPTTGETEFYQITPARGDGAPQIQRIQPPGAAAGAAPQVSPYAPTGKLTGEESNARLFAGRMVNSHNILLGLEEKINEGVGGAIGGIATGFGNVRDAPGINYLLSADRQKVIQAQRDFVNAVLRKESGAAIGDKEFSNAIRQYFPQPGEDPATIEQKRLNRMLVIEGMMAGAGRGYRPPTEYVGTRGPAYQEQPAAPTPQQPATAPGTRSSPLPIPTGPDGRPDIGQLKADTWYHTSRGPAKWIGGKKVFQTP
jgi:hypothetical protein